MKSLRTIFFLSAAIVLLTAPALQAAPTVGVYFGPDGNSDVYSVAPFKAFQIHVVISEVEDQVSAVEYKLNLPDAVIVVASSYWGDRSIVFGDPATTGTALGLGECVPVFSDVVGYESLIVATITAMTSSPFGASPVTLTKFEGGSEAPSVNAPRYSNCDGVVSEMSVTNGTLTSAVATDAASWSSVKALYE